VPCLTLACLGEARDLTSPIRRGLRSCAGELSWSDPGKRRSRFLYDLCQKREVQRRSMYEGDRGGCSRNLVCGHQLALSSIFN
jgi:hypothetical protein